jgi:hypothetical protein
MYVTKRNAVVVRRASHVQKVPQVKRPQRLPVTREIAMNTTPTSAEAPAIRSHVNDLVRFHR